MERHFEWGKWENTECGLNAEEILRVEIVSRAGNGVILDEWRA